MRSLRTTAVLVLLGGCKPTPPPGAYLCSPEDQACPGSQHCTCGLCVDVDGQAACGFTLQTDASVPRVEHESFPLTINALDPTGAASSFSGTVQLSAAWGDVRPSAVQLQGGTTTVKVSLNREAPQGDVITVHFAGAQASTPPIVVVPAPFVADSPETYAPDASFGPAYWAVATRYGTAYVGSSGRFESIFIGGTGKQRALGHAVADDDAGARFAPDPSPIWGPTRDAGFPTDLAAVSVYSLSDGGYMLAYSNEMKKGLFLATFNANAPQALDCDAGPCVPQCPFCDTAGSDPYVVEVPPQVNSSCGQGPLWLMYFQSQRKIPSGLYDVTALGVATSCDGINFVPFPRPVLVAQDLFSSVVFAPRVLVDGHVYKMWFTYALDPNNAIATEFFCGPDVDAGIGYATSRDGLSWVPSPANPVLSTAQAPFWQNGFTAHTLRATAVIPSDGVDPWNGIALYYTPYTTPLTDDAGCGSGGMARAVRN